MVERMLGPRRLSANALSKEVGVGQPILSQWLRQAGNNALVSKHEIGKRSLKRPEDWTPAEKFEAVMEAAAVAEEDLGVWLRKKGVTEEHLRQWRELALSGIAIRPKRASSEERQKIETLEKELRRKDKALAETAALLVLQGKMQALWAEEDDATRQGNDEPSSKGSRKPWRRGPV
jgi:transposase